MRIARPILTALFTVLLASSASAQIDPGKPIKLIVGFPAGGANDTVARIVTQALSSKLKQTIVVGNVAGAGGIIAAQQAVSAEPDGHTLLMTVPSNTFGTARHLYKLDYDPVQALAPVAMLASDKQVMVASPTTPVA